MYIQIAQANNILYAAPRAVAKLGAVINSGEPHSTVCCHLYWSVKSGPVVDSVEINLPLPKTAGVIDNGESNLTLSFTVES